MVLLFLDFDGVLHPGMNGGRDNFCRLALFEAVVREHPEVSIVISSSWRHAFSFGELRAFFSPDVAQRIVGVTEDGSGLPRHVEIARYLERHAHPGCDWVALDDSAFEFPARCENLVLCDSRVGLDPGGAQRLRNRLRALART